MTKADVLAILTREAEAVKALGATALYLFGSTQRQMATAQSDIDLFVDYDTQGTFSLIELVAIKQHLENRLGVRVDLTTRDSLDPLLRHHRSFGRTGVLMEREVSPALQAILEAIHGIETATRGKSLQEFSADWLLRHGVQRGIEIISEAARRIPPTLQERQPHIPWAEITGIGNVLRHE